MQDLLLLLLLLLLVLMRLSREIALHNSAETMPHCLQLVKAEIVLWTAGFVLLTLVINASLLPWGLRVLKLNWGGRWLSLSLVLSAPIQAACSLRVMLLLSSPAQVSSCSLHICCSPGLLRTVNSCSRVLCVLKLKCAGLCGLSSLLPVV